VRGWDNLRELFEERLESKGAMTNEGGGRLYESRREARKRRSRTSVEKKGSKASGAGRIWGRRTRFLHSPPLLFRRSENEGHNGGVEESEERAKIPTETVKR